MAVTPRPGVPPVAVRAVVALVAAAGLAFIGAAAFTHIVNDALDDLVG